MIKQLLILLGMLAVIPAFAAENLIRPEGGWPNAAVDAELSQAEGTRVLRLSKSKGWIYIGDKMTIDPAKTYTISMDLRSADPAALSRMNYIGLVMYDERNRAIVRDNVQSVPGAFAKVAADTPAGAVQITLDRVVDLSNAAKKGLCLAINAKEDFSDMPNPTRTGKITKVQTVDGKTVVTLAAPYAKALPAGTPVRVHYIMAGFSYGILLGGLGAEWKHYTVRVSGVAMDGSAGYDKFWPGAKTFQLLFVVNPNANIQSSVLIKNISVTAE